MLNLLQVACQWDIDSIHDQPASVHRDCFTILMHETYYFQLSFMALMTLDFLQSWYFEEQFMGVLFMLHFMSDIMIDVFHFWTVYHSLSYVFEIGFGDFCFSFNRFMFELNLSIQK